MKRTSILALFCCLLYSAQGQFPLRSAKKDSIEYDTIPAKLLLYRDHCELCPAFVEQGYVVFENWVITDSVKFLEHDGKVRSGAFYEYGGEPERTQVNPYLRHDKKTLWLDVSVWDYKLERPCKMNPARGI